MANRKLPTRDPPTPQIEEYVRFQTAKEALQDAEALKAAGHLEKAFDMLCRALEKVITDTDDDLEELENRYHDLDGRVG
ncbi:hypothetical protein NKJ72_19255 [Mesorhizobium sp. M0045]|uniref:hypothetical protein n=1 Tax=Mesorhizobium sp. M0045 TaxID=2956857 RepID=UPI003339EABC